MNKFWLKCGTALAAVTVIAASAAVANADEATSDHSYANVVIAKDNTAPAPASNATAPSAETTTPAPTTGDTTKPSDVVIADKDEVKSNDHTAATPVLKPGTSTDKIVKSDESAKPSESTEEAPTVATQIGEVSPVTNQEVRNVSAANPVVTSQGQVITGVQNGVATLDNGQQAKLEDLGATKNSDKTYTVTNSEGKKETLPETGDSQVGVFALVGAIMTAMGLALFGKKKTTN